MGAKKNKPLETYDIIVGVFEAPVDIGGVKPRLVTKEEYLVRNLVARAVAGDLSSADMLIDLYRKRRQSFEKSIIVLTEEDVENGRLPPNTTYRKGHPK